MESLPGHEPYTEKLTQAELASRVLHEQRQEWEAGHAIPVEALLQNHPTLKTEQEAVLDLIYGEVVMREQRGEKPTLDEYQRRFPHLAEHIKDQFDVHQAVGTETAVDPHQTIVRAEAQTTPVAGYPAVGLPEDLAGFEILEVLGRGGMGVVYKARQIRLKRFVAVKMIRAGQDDPNDLARFRAEAESAARLQHPNIVQVFEVGEYQGQMYLALEYVAGGSLAQHLKGNPQPAREAARFVEILARAIQHAHERGIVHRDMKPANILLMGGDTAGSNDITEKRTSSTPFSIYQSPLITHQPKITDFGLAKQMEASISAPKTETGAILGTPSYMAPEQAEGRIDEIGPATDIYSLGAILYEMVTGRPPFRAASVLETIRQVAQEEVVPPRRLQPDLPRDLETICLHCLEKISARRYETALALAEDLNRFVIGEPIQARPISAWERGVKWARRRPALAALVAVSILATLGLLGLGAGLWYNAEQRAAITIDLETARSNLADLNKQAEQRRTEVDQLEKASHRLANANRRSRYVGDMHQANQGWNTNNFLLLNETLDRYGPDKPDHDLRGFEWYYLKHLSKGSKLSFSGQTMAAFHPTEPWIATLDKPSVIKLYNVKTKEEIFLKKHTAAVTGLTFMPEGNLLVSASRDKTLCYWKFPGGNLEKQVDHPGPIQSLAISPKGEHLATGGSDGMVRLWQGPDFTKAILCKGHKGLIIALAFSPSNRMLASGGADGVTKTWDTKTGSEIHDIRGHTAFVTAVAFSPDNRILATSSIDKTVRLWDTDKGRQLQVLRGHLGTVSAVAFDPLGVYLATGSWDKTIKLWRISRVEADEEIATLLRTFTGHSEEVTSVAFSGDAQAFLGDSLFLLSASRDNTVRLWDAKVRPEGYKFDKHMAKVNDVVFHPYGKVIASASNDKTVKLYDLATGRERKALHGHTTFVVTIAFSGDGKLLASAGGNLLEKKGEIFLWDGQTGDLIRQVGTRAAPIYSVVFLPDDKTLVTGGHDGSIAVWDTAAGKIERQWQAHLKPVSQVDVSADGKQLASAGTDGLVKMWETASGAELVSLKEHHGDVNSVAFHPKGRFLASAGEDKQILIWDLVKKSIVRKLKGHEGAVNWVAYSKDGQRLVSASADKTAKIWDPEIGQEILALGHALRLPVDSAVLSPDGKLLASGAGNSVFVWGAEKTK